MIKELNDLVAFHKAFGLTVNTKPTIPDFKTARLRAKLIMEEAAEVEEELIVLEGDNNIDKIAKELADLLYVTYGTVVSYGLTDIMPEVFAEVHRSNMSKLDENGNVIRREDGKVLKSNLYSPADIKSILEK